MTESEWLACTDPQTMLDFLHGKASERKQRLFATASFRRLAYMLPDSRQRRGIELLEHMAEGTVTLEASREVVRSVRLALPSSNAISEGGTDDPYYVALMLYRALVSSSAAGHAVQAVAGLAYGSVEQKEQSRLLREIFGNPWRALSIPFYWLAWNDGTIRKLAQVIYDDPAFDRLPLLVDALEDAGCTDSSILAHCRGGGEHVRGCWVVDLLLGKA